MVDEVVRRHAPEFIRFVDDYRIFGKSRSALEDAFGRINKGLSTIGFTVSMSKVKLGSSDEYLDAIAGAGNATTKADGSYISAAVLSDIVAPDQLVELIARVVERPDELMNEGMGRLLLGAIRRMRLNHDVAMLKNYCKSPFDTSGNDLPKVVTFAEEIRRRPNLMGAAAQLLERYAAEPEESWRAVWIIYVFSSFLPKSLRETIGADSRVPPIVQLWARAASERRNLPATEFSVVDDLDYLEKGRKYYG